MQTEETSRKTAQLFTTTFYVREIRVRRCFELESSGVIRDNLGERGDRRSAKEEWEIERSLTLLLGST